MSSLKSLIMQHNERSGTLVEPIRMTFGDEEVVKARTDGKGIDEKEEEYLQKPYKEFLKSLFTKRIIEFSAQASACYKFEDIRWFALRSKCCKDPTEVSKIIRIANETLPDYKERWTEEMSYIQDVSEVMHISAFMSTSKCPELARRFSDQVPKTVTEMMKRVDDFVKSEEAFKSTELPKGEFSEKGQGTSYRGSRPPRAAYEGRQHRTDNYNNFNHRDHF
ncbi:hypothetical protein Tco_0485616 [Tanacetum coccineum]